MTDTRQPGADQRFPPGMQRRVGMASVTEPEPSGSTRAVVILPLGPVRRQRSSAVGGPLGAAVRVADAARRSRRVGGEDVSAVDGRIEPARRPRPPAARRRSWPPPSAGSRRRCPRASQGCGWPIRGAQRPKEVKNCGQPHPQAEATSDVSARKPTEACRRAKPALWRKEECIGKDRRDALCCCRQEHRPCLPAAASPYALAAVVLAFRPRQ